ncbi:MAG: hypothetical protein IPG69_02830 [Flavobacteriales bacterium]|nr:hypothetical protein [Flavobacteriales bacterium]
MLAAIAFIASLGAFASLLDEVVLGIDISSAIALNLFIGFVPWYFYLIVLVLRRLRGESGGRREKAFLISTSLVFTLLVAALVNRQFMGADGIVIHDALSTRQPVKLVLVAVFILTLIVFFLGAIVEVVRTGIRLLRAKGYQRWVGGGAILAILIGGALEMINGVQHGTHHSWLGRISEYFSNLGIPVSIAIYLAIRSAHHSKAVSRQRDDLDREVQERTADLSREKQRSDDLLLNILPEEVAEELKNTGAAQAKQFDTATILFTDFKGFTQLSEQVTPAELVAELNTCFKSFDHIITARGIEKIKTIGDAYMAAGGLPDPASSSPADVVFAALEMQEFMKHHKAERQAVGKPFFEMRVGIHSGPVVAGIVGVKKFQYDIWGDTVNTASRMESSGEVGQVNISEATYGLVKNEPGLSFAPRGKVQAKGKGEMEMFFVV